MKHTILGWCAITVLAGCGGESAAPTGTGQLPATGATASPRISLDMSKPLHAVEHCDTVPLPTADLIRHAGTGVKGDFRAAVLGRVSGLGPTLWNTADGHRPTNEDLRAGLLPAIYTAVTFSEVKGVAGGLGGPTLTAYVRGGTIGNDSFAGCSVGARLTVGQTYLVLLGEEIVGDVGATKITKPRAAAVVILPGGSLPADLVR